MKKIVIGIFVFVLMVIFNGCGKDFKKNYEYNFDESISIGYTENIEFSEISNVHPKKLIYLKKDINEIALIEVLVCNFNNSKESMLVIRAENGFRIWQDSGNVDNIIIYDITQNKAIVVPMDSEEITSDYQFGKEQIIGFHFEEECKKYYIEIL